MAKQLNVSLAFTADTSKAKAELQDLQRQLTQLTNAPVSNSGKGFFLTKEIQEASAAAADLRIKLQQATDINTGKLDLNKFDQSLKNSGTSLKTYREALSNLGPAGDKAFASLASSILKADVPLKTTNKLLNEFKTTLMNTARWQISSSILHGFMGTLQSAYGYAQDLNQSLNNIRIVTGYSNDEMAKFAESANKAAQSLSTTTTKYTDAALIYYQQGIRDEEEIAGRTETTIKLANVSRQSAEEVSSQMTAIWNNFDNGSHSLEYYADVITALGANTASSSQEIAKGMQQFAAVADTVGLSYEYAAASLATIVATTRQSESTVGNGLRTIFSRLEGLKLGDTLEDGTDLNKYSAALATIGVNIKDASGSLKDMDTILEETASKWDQLDKAQKVAFATTVGGVRQYTNLIALLDHWDMVQENIGIAKNSEGTLQEQADIYAESWEAAQKRVRAAAEEIYQELLNDDFFITLLDGFKEVLDIINNTIDAIGGLKGVLIAVGAIVTNLFQKEIASEINRIGQNIRIATGQAAQATTARKAEAAREMQQMTANSIDENTGNAMSTIYTQQGQLQQELINNAGRLSDERKKELQTLLDINNAIGQSVIKMNEAADAAEKQLATDERRLLLKSSDIGFQNDISNYTSQMKSYGTISAGAQGLKAAFKEVSIEGDQINISLENVNSCLERLKTTADGINFKDDAGATEEIKDWLEEAQTIINQMQNASGEVLEGLKKDAQDTFEIIDKLTTQAGNARIKYQVDQSSEDKKEVENLGTKAFETGQQVEGAKQSVDQFRTSSQKLGQDIKNPVKGMTDFGKQATATAAAITTTIMVVNNLSNAIKTLANPDLNAYEKFTGVLGSLAMTVPMVISTITQLTTAFGSVGAAVSVAGSAVSGFLAFLGPAGIALGIATIAVIGFYSAWKKHEEENSPENQLKKINEELGKTKTLLEETTSEVNNLKSSFDNYNSIIDKLKTIDRNTAEWKNSLIDAQNAAQKLINTYQLLEGKDWNYNSSGGYIEFTEEGKAKATGIVNSRQTSASIYNQAATVQSLQKQIEVNNDKINTNNSFSTSGFDNQIKQLTQAWNGSLQSTMLDNYRMTEDQMRQHIESYNQVEWQRQQELMLEGIDQQNADKSHTFFKIPKEQLQYAFDTTETLMSQTAASYARINGSISEENNAILQKNNLLEEQIKLTEQQSILTANRNTENYNADAELLYSKYLQGTNEDDARAKLGLNFSGDDFENLLPDQKQALAEQYYRNIYGDRAQVSNGKVSILQDDNTWGEAKEFDINSIVKQLIAEAVAQPSNQEEVNKAFNEALSSLDETNIDESTKKNLANVLADASLGNLQKLDLNKFNSKDILNLNIDELNIEERFKDQLNAYQVAMQKLLPMKTFEEASESYNTITSAGSNIKENNSIIDDKSYQALAEAGIAVDTYFEQMADGTHQLITDASDFKRVVQDIAMKDMYDAAQNSANQTTALNNLSSAEGYSSQISDDDKNSILQMMGVSNEEIANIQMIEDSVARTEAYAEKFNELDLTGNTEKINDLLKDSAENSKQIQEAINNTNFKNDVERYGLDLEDTTRYAKELQEQFKNTGKSETEVLKASRDLAISNQRLDRGLDDLNSNLKKYQKSLKDTNRGTAEYSSTMNDFKDSLSDMLNIADGDMLSDTFAESFLEGGDNAEKFKDALDGDVDAILELRMAAADDIIANLVVNNNLDVTQEEITSRWEIIKGIIENNEINAPGFDQTQLIESFNQLIAAGNMTKEQIEAALAGLHVSANVKTNYVSQPVQVPQTITEESMLDAGTDTVMVPDNENGGWKEQTITLKRKLTRTYDAGVVTVDGYVPQYEIEGTEGEGSITTGVTALPPPKASGGSTTSGKGGKGGGGGGGGKGSKPKTKEKTKVDESKLKKEDDEIERYHRIRNELEDITHELTMIGKAKDRAFGRNKIKQLDAETASLKKQSAAQKRYLQEIQGWLEKDNAKAKEFGFKVDATGLVTNYEENMRTLMNKADEEYKAHVAKLNEIEEAYDALSAAGDESAEEVYKKAKEEEDEKYKKLEEYYENAKKALAKQEETHDLLLKTQEELRDTENAIYDNGVYRITYAVELKIDVKDRDIALLEDLLEDIGDKADGACDAIANFGNQLEDTLDKVDTYTQEVSDILEHANADQDLIDKILNHDFDESDWEDVLNIGQDGKGLNEDEIDHLKSIADALLESNKEMRRLREEALKKTGEAFDEFNEQLDRSVGQIEHLTTVTQTYRDVLDIVGKDVLDRNGKLTDALNKQTYNIQRNHTHALQAQLDFIDNALNEAQTLYDEAVQNGYNQQTLESLRADVEKYEDERQSTYEEWLDSWKQECQIAKDYYEDTLNQILSDFEDAVAGQFKNLSGLSEEFARKNEIADIYVDDYEKIYQLSKLNRDINNSLDDSTTLASKGKLRDIQKEINDLQESGVEVSQYDLDVLRKKYEMALAYEQWQDAQNAKTIVRMQRDNEGNYGYVYTADQADVEAAEQNYEDKLHEMQVLNAEYIQSLQEQIIQAQQDCSDALANLRAEDFASYEEYQNAVEQLHQDYTKRVETLSQQMENAMNNNRDLYENDWTAYSQATGYKISADEDYIDKFNETVYSQLTGFETMQEAQNVFVEAVNDATDLAAENWEDWYIRTNTALDDAGLSMQNYVDEVGDRVEQLGEEAERAEEDVWNMSDEFSDAYSNISDTVGNFLDEYSNYIDAMIDANQELVDSINQVITAYAELKGMENGGDDETGISDEGEIDADWFEQYDDAGNLSGWKAKNKVTGEWITGENKKVKWAGNDQIEGYSAFYNFDSSGLMQTSGRNDINTGFAGTTFTDEEKKKYYKIVSGASGMYTGDWGDNSGKLAILHKKELVLNEDDTSNILSAVDMIRSISNAIDLNALAAGSAFAGRSSAVLSSLGGRDGLEQNVHITAEFPSVNDHNEIEQALSSLIERAAQFAGRKKF